MTTFETVQVHCEILEKSVTISKQTFMISGIGDTQLYRQNDYNCSDWDNCQFRTSLNCLQLKLNNRES
ncbi:hypothetical protein EKO24_012970 [Candidatus Methylobacter oryzae]|uniref:Uncharacterized protein n=1 Tax=Candidatus Methylobacter oryzae TaxID=2497749 RepID=A0ABY3C998_9GAMM|nr:hypothetical protein EKO24_012970 [Candidatus Methylobacter oryzae]